MKETSKKMLAVLIVLAMIISIISPMTLTVSASVWNGTPDTSWYTGSSPYTIMTAEQLAGLASLSTTNNFEGETIILGADIVLNDTSNFANWESSPPANQWTPIGTSDSRFKGTFDGNGHTISGLYISKSSEYYKGLFMYTAGNIRNLTLTDCYIYANGYAGGISYYCGSVARITNCSVSGIIKVTGSYAGGIVGQTENGTIISKCINNASVTAGKTSGGIVGVNNGTVADCYNTGNIAGNDSPYSDAAGIAGNNNIFGLINNCYNLGNLSAIDTAGGIVSYNEGSISNLFGCCNRWN
jgi:hypothetical protein